MIYDEDVTQGVRDDATADPHRARQRTAGRRWADVLKHRWPTWLAIAITALTAGGDSSGSDSLEGLSDALLIFALNYLVLAVLQRRRATWVVATVVISALVALRFQDWVDPSVVLLVAALAFVVWAAVRGQLRRPGAVMLETAGMLVFTALALAALSVDRELGRYLLAAGWLGHAAWDFAHYRADKVVSRSFAEWCAVVDLLGGVAILVLQPMIDGLLFVLTLLSALGCGLVGGVFFAFSAFVMTALARLPPAQGIAAMQSINVVVLNRWFLAPFFGTALACVALAVQRLPSGADPRPAPGPG